ncbi:CBS domain-containing protein [Denitromonas sp. IR12]|uniref:histidine kinase n=2 Tax=Denitromonas iodatirespirans TaxID=2795389 RepID=A0A944DBF6_DENI1|nr:CBS domain-containing protein [Denitromonas iodatirespirans]
MSTDTLLPAALSALSESPSHAVLAEHDGQIVGILTERSALALGTEAPSGNRRLGDVCQHAVLWAEADENYIDAYERMLGRGMRHAVVRDPQGRTLGLLSESAILGRMGIEHFAHLDAIEQIMTPDPVTVGPDTSVFECVTRMRQLQIGCVMIATDDGMPAGILTTRDVTRLMARRSALQTLPAAEVMSRPVIQLEAERPVFEAAREMAMRGIRHIVVTRNDRLCGIVSEHDIVRCLEHRYVDVLRRVITRQARELDGHRQAVLQANVIDQFLSRSQALGLCLVGTDGQIAFINPAARALLDVAADAAARHLSDVLEALPPDSRLQLSALSRLAAPDGPVSIRVGDRHVLVRAHRFVTDASRGTQAQLLILIDDSVASEAGELIGFSRHAFGTMALPMMWADTAGKVTLSNAAFDQLVARTDPATPLDLGTLFSHAGALLDPSPDDAEALRVRCTLHRLDHRDIPVELFFSRMAFLGKRYLGGFIIDLSPQRAIEQALQDAEQRLTTLLQTSPDFIALKDPDGRWLLANPAGLRMYGLTHIDWRGKDNRQLAARVGETMRDPLERCSNTDQLAWSRREPVRYIEEIPHTEAPGTRSLDMIKTPILGADGQPKALMVIGRDITERVDAERARREADARLHGALAGIDDLMLIADCAGLVHDHYPKPTPPRFQLPDTGLNGLPVETLLPPEAIAPFQLARQKLRDGLGVQSFDYAVNRDGQAHWFNVRLSRHRHVAPLGGGMTVMIRDITASRKTAEQLERLEATVDDRVDERTGELQSALEELEAFSYSLSHDLRAPLRAIDGFGRLLAQNIEAQLDPTDREYLKRIQAGVQRMNGLIDDMLDLARLSRKPVERQTVDLSQMAQRVLTDLADREPERALTWEIAPGLYAEADPILMQSVLDNLLGNAWKFTRKTEAAHVKVYAEERKGRRWIVIQDNGAGFDMSYADKLFKPFQRLHSPRDFDGTGVGLATVQRIISRHNGQIEAEAAEHHGATFRFWLDPSPPG